MKIKLLFTGLCFCFAAHYSYGQSQTQALKDPIPIVVSSHPDLNVQRMKLDAKQAEINQAVSSSRAQMSKLNDEFLALKQEYVRLLSAEMEKTAEAELKVQLQEEITRYSGVANSTTR